MANKERRVEASATLIAFEAFFLSYQQQLKSPFFRKGGEEEKVGVGNEEEVEGE